MAQGIADASTVAVPPRSLERILDDVRSKVNSCGRMQLEDELAELTAFDPNPRNRVMAAAYLGWQGPPFLTLKQVGSRYRITRQRVLQILHMLADRLRATAPYLPALDRVLKASADAIPCCAEQLEIMLAERGLSRGRFCCRGVISAAKIAGRSCPFVLEMVDGMLLAVPPGGQGVARLLLQVARPVIHHSGVAAVDDIAARVSLLAKRTIAPTVARALLVCHPQFRWLDEKTGVFWIKGKPRNRLLNQIQKVLAVAPRIHVAELGAGLVRHYRHKDLAPPQGILLALCAQIEGCQVDGLYVLSKPSAERRRALSKTEAVIADLLTEHGPVVNGAKLKELCLARGLACASIRARLEYSPVIVRSAPGLYGLCGSVPRG
jgi:hypothetical protein